MPKVKIHLPESLTTEENFEDILTFVNKDIEKDKDKHKNIYAWMRGLLRQFAVFSKASQDRWESNKTIQTSQGEKSIPDLKFWEGEVPYDVFDDSLGGREVFISMGEVQTKWLIKATIWENTMKIEVLEHENPKIFSNVAELCQNIVLSAILQLQIQIDNEKLILEAEELEDEIEE